MGEIRLADSPKITRRYGRNILVAILLGFSINIVLGLFVDYEKFKDGLVHAQAWEIALPALAISLVYLVDSLRYLVVFRQFGIRLRFRDALYNNVVGYFFCNVTPSAAGGQPFQIHHFRKIGIDTTIATNVVFSRLLVANVSQLLIVLAFAHRSLVLLSSTGRGAWLLGLGLATTAGLTALLVSVFLNPSLIGKLAQGLSHVRLGRRLAKLAGKEGWADEVAHWCQSLGESFRFLWSEKRQAILADFLLFLFDQVLWAFGLYFPLAAITKVRLPFGDFLFAFILCGLVSAYIPTPGASGSVEAAYALVLGGMTASFGASLTAVFLWRLGAYYLHLLLGGLVYFLVPFPRKEEADILRP